VGHNDSFAGQRAEDTHTSPEPFSLKPNSAFSKHLSWCLSVLAERHHSSWGRSRILAYMIGSHLSHAEETLGTTDCREFD